MHRPMQATPHPDCSCGRLQNTSACLAPPHLLHPTPKPLGRLLGHGAGTRSRRCAVCEGTRGLLTAPGQPTTAGLIVAQVMCMLPHPGLRTLAPQLQKSWEIMHAMLEVSTGCTRGNSFYVLASSMLDNRGMQHRDCRKLLVLAEHCNQPSVSRPSCRQHQAGLGCGAHTRGPPMIEVVCNDRLGKKIRVKCNEDDTIGDLKKLIAAQASGVACKLGLLPGSTCMCSCTSPMFLSVTCQADTACVVQ